MGLARKKLRLSGTLPYGRYRAGRVISMAGFMNPREKLNEGEVITDLGLKDLTRQTLTNGGLFLDDLGLDITKPGQPVPESNGVPRIFLLKDGRITSLEQENLEVGSRQFWEAAMLGQVFAYPAGEKHPVQIQARKVGSSEKIKVQLSEPLDPEKLPEPEIGARPTVPRKPRFYHRWFRFFGNNRKICSDWDAYVKSDSDWRARRESVSAACKATAETIRQQLGGKRTADFLIPEKGAAEDAKQAHSEEKARSFSAAKLRVNQEFLGRTEEIVEAVGTLYQPRPEKHEDWTKPDPEHPDPAHTGDVYTEEQFALLKPLELNGAAVGGQPVTDREFAGLAMCAALDPDIALEAQRVVAPTEPLIAAYRKDGFSEADAKEIIMGNSSEYYTSTMMDVPPRADSGNFFKAAVEPGRESAHRALQEYCAGNKAAMADMLSRMVALFGRESLKNTAMDPKYFARNRIAMDMVRLMERDPELMALAKQKYEERENGFHQRNPRYLPPASFEEHLKTFRQVEELDKLKDKQYAAKIKLLEARLDGRELSAEEKEACTKDILRYNLLTDQMRGEVFRCFLGKPNEYNKVHLEMEEHARTVVLANSGQEENAANSNAGSSLPADPANIMISSLGGRCFYKPPVMNKLGNPKAMEDLDRGLDNLIRAEGLDKAGTRELSDKLAVDEHRQYQDNKLTEKMLRANANPDNQANRDAPEKNLEKPDNKVRPTGFAV